MKFKPAGMTPLKPPMAAPSPAKPSLSAPKLPGPPAKARAPSPIAAAPVHPRNNAEFHSLGAPKGGKY